MCISNIQGRGFSFETWSYPLCPFSRSFDGIFIGGGVFLLGGGGKKNFGKMPQKFVYITMCYIFMILTENLEGVFQPGHPTGYGIAPSCPLFRPIFVVFVFLLSFFFSVTKSNLSLKKKFINKTVVLYHLVFALQERGVRGWQPPTTKNLYKRVFKSGGFGGRQPPNCLS